MNNLKNDIEKKLKNAGADYSFTPIPESLPLDVASHAAYLKISMSQALATLLYRTDKGIVAVQRGADRKVDEAKLRELLGVKKLEMAKKQDLEELGVESGLVPLTGLDIPFYMDKVMMELGYVYGGSGAREFNLKIDPSDLQRINNAVVSEFTDQEVDVSNGKRRVFAGLRPTSELHVGNYLGSMKGMVELQDRLEFDCIFGVMDLHAIIVPYDAKDLQNQNRGVVLNLLGAGLDPKKCHLVIQSQLAPEHTELAYYLASKYPFSRLEDLPTYKDKKATYPNDVNVGLYYYPVLMAADILAYNAEYVPVGLDQEPHLEVAREMARNINRIFGTSLVEPKRFDTPGRNVPSIVGDGKMSKSKGGTILLTDSLEQIQAILAKATTDSGKGEKFPVEGPAANFVNFAELFLGHDRAMQLREEYKTTGLRYGDLKKELAEAIYKELKPIQERRKYFEEHPEEVDQILLEGREYAKNIADETLREVREKMGLTM